MGWLYWQQQRLFQNMNAIVSAIGELATRPAEITFPEPVPEEAPKDANRWIRKPTPVITPSMVSESPSRCRPKAGRKSPTAIQVQSTISWLPPSKPRMASAVAEADTPIEPTPIAAEVFSENFPREKESSR